MKRAMMVAALALLVTGGAAHAFHEYTQETQGGSVVMKGAVQANECNEGEFRSNENGAHSNCIELQLSAILGSEEACGLKYDGEAIKAFIVNQIHDDVTFMSALIAMTKAKKDEAKEMPRHILAAQCIIVRRFAEREGFIK